MFQSTAPILPALNIQNTNLFYKHKLNFDTMYSGNYLVVRKGKIELYFYEVRESIFKPASCYIFVSNIEDVYAQFSATGLVDPKGKLAEKPGTIREFFITDNNGNTLYIGEKH